MAMTSNRANPPRVVIELPLEEPPRVRIHCANESEERRIRDWITNKPELYEFVCYARALELERRAA